jgi:hypothetical protein
LSFLKASLRPDPHKATRPKEEKLDNFMQIPFLDSSLNWLIHEQME